MYRSNTGNLLSELHRYNQWKCESRPCAHANFSPTASICIKNRAIYKRKSGRKLRGEFQELKKRYWGQHLWARGYFVATSGQISIKEVQKYIEEQEEHHKQNSFKISEF